MEEALSTAEELFWRKGYDGTSLSDLTEAMGIVPPSFYFAFKSKEALFQRVLERYLSGHMSYFEDALREVTAFKVAKRLLYGFAKAHTEPSRPPGCLGLNCALPVVGTGDPVRLGLADVREMARLKLKARFQQAIKEFDLEKGAKADALARYLLAVGWGMAVDAQSGATRKQLRATAAIALRACFDDKTN